MQKVRQAVDHGNARFLCELFDEAVAEGARHDAVDPAREGPGHVLRRLARPDPDLLRTQQDGVTSELGHARLEGHVGAQRRLLEVHRQGLAAKRLMTHAVPVKGLQLL